MTKLFTFREAAERFCQLDGRPEQDVSSVYLQIKGLYDRGLLEVAPARAARGANQISTYEICRARLLLVLIEFGVQGEQLARANAMLDDGGRTVTPNGGNILFSLKGLLAAGAAPWVLRVNMVRDQLKGGQLKFSAKLLPAWMAIGKMKSGEKEGDPTDPENDVVFLGSTHLAFLKIPASALIAPLLADA